MGVLWHKDGRISQPLIKALQKNNPQMTIGDNQPYSIPDDPTYSHSVARHALRYGLPYTCIEFRQDLVADEESAERMAKIYLESLKPFLDDADLYTPFFEAA